VGRLLIQTPSREYGLAKTEQIKQELLMPTARQWMQANLPGKPVIISREGLSRSGKVSGQTAVWMKLIIFDALL
jgi:hypothetical protein